MLIRLQNARKAGHASVQMPYSALKHDVARALERGGYLTKVERRGKRVRKVLEVTFSSGEGRKVFSRVRLLSTSSRQLYSPYRALRPMGHGGTVIVSTPKGMLTSDEARRARVGGVLIAEVW